MKIYQSLVEMQEASCKKFKDREMYGRKDDKGTYRWITYGEYGRLVQEARGAFVSLGVEEGKRIGIIANNCIEWAVSCYATMGMKASFVPMYESQTLDDYRHILRDAEIQVLFVANKQIYHSLESILDTLPFLTSIVILHLGKSEKLPETVCGINLLTWHQFLKQGRKYSSHVIPAARDDVATIIYTSGTTGLPKGVLLTHGNLLFNLEAAPTLIDLNETDRSLSFLPWAHVFGQMAEVHLLLISGFSAAIVENSQKIIDDLKVIRPTVLFSVPRVFNKIYESIQSKLKEQPLFMQKMFEAALNLAAKKKKGEPLSVKEKLSLAVADKLFFRPIRQKLGGRLRYAVSGASAFNPTVAEFIDYLDIMVLEAYGLSETAPLIASNSFRKRKLGTVGLPIRGLRVEIDRSCFPGGESGIDGEIVVYGECVMKGYLNLPEETAAVFNAEGGLKTGDLGRLDDEGFLLITGRIKEQYKLENGKYVVPSLIEEQLKLGPYISHAFVYGPNRRHNVALLGVDMKALMKYAKQNNISARGRNLLKTQKVRDLYREELERLQVNVRSYERVRDFTLVADDWSPQNGILTPSLKLKRRVVYSKYKTVIEDLYGTETLN